MSHCTSTAPYASHAPMHFRPGQMLMEVNVGCASVFVLHYLLIFDISSPVVDHIINGAQTHFWYTILLTRRVSATCVCAPPTAACCSAANHQTRPGVPVTLTMSEPPTGSEDDKTKKRKVMPRVLCTTHWPAFIPSITTHSSSTTTSPLYTTLCFTQSKTRPVIHSTSCCSPLVLVVSSVRYQWYQSYQ